MSHTRFHRARVAAGLSLQQVVDRLPARLRVSRAALHKYETGASKPAAGMYLALAAMYGVRSSSFFSDPAVTIEWAPLFRPREVAARALRAFQAQAAEQAERQITVERLFPEPRLAKLPTGIAVGTLQQAEAAADRVRQAWRMGVGPLASLTDTIEYHGGTVVALPNAPRGFESMRGCSERGELVFVVRLDATPEQRRFDLACELGGFVMAFARRAKLTPLIRRFAAALLVPAEEARRELGERRSRVTAEELELLGARYGVSSRLVERRAIELQIVRGSGQVESCGELAYPMTPDPSATPPMVRDAERPHAKFHQQLLRAVHLRHVGHLKAEQLLPALRKPAPPRPEQPGVITARQLLKMPRAERSRLLREAAERLAPEYAPGGSLEIFEAFGEKDFYDYDEQPEE